MIYILSVAFAVAGLLTSDGEWAIAAVLLYCTSRVLERLEEQEWANHCNKWLKQ